MLFTRVLYKIMLRQALGRIEKKYSLVGDIALGSIALWHILFDDFYRALPQPD
jgi:hypothetical protein